MGQKDKMISIFESCGVELNNKIESCKLKHLKVNDETSTWRFCLTFDDVLTFDELRNIINKVSEYVKSEFNILNVKFTIDYPGFVANGYNMDEKDLKSLFKYAIDVCMEIKKGVTILNEYYTLYDENTITVCVATEEEEIVARGCFSLIEKFFYNYGYNFIKFKTKISEDVRNIKEQSEEKKQIQIMIDETKSHEEYRMRKEAAKENQTLGTFSYKNNNNYVYKKISDLPYNSMEIEEFKQIESTEKVTVTGTLVNYEIRAFKSRQGRDFNLLVGSVTNYLDTIIFKRFLKESEIDSYKKTLKNGIKLEVKGKLQWDDFARDVVIMCDQIIVLGQDISRVRFDEALNKRVELHAHSKMSVLDSIMDVSEYVKQAKSYGHKAIAVTDHANCHVLPEFFSACKKANIKPIAGVEGYYINDELLNIAFTNHDIMLKDATYVIFDIETSGLYIPFNEIIEIGAVKVKNGIIIDEFASLIRPKKKLHKQIIDITHITNEMLEDQLMIEDVLPKFKDFIKDTILVAHNAHFDSDFIYACLDKMGLFDGEMPCIDTMMFARGLYGSDFKQNNLRAVGKFLKVEVEPNEQHRAVYDARTTANIFQKLLAEALDRGYTNYNELNKMVSENELFRYKIPSHINILVQNKKGLKNFYKIISESHTTYFQKDARVLKSLIEKYRDGILVGSGCGNGEIFRLALEKTNRQLLDAIDFYDYIEVQPPGNYLNFFDMWTHEEALEMAKSLIKQIINAAKIKNKIVVATGDVHELIKEDGEYRKIYLSVARPNGGGPHELSKFEGTLDMHYRNTTEMLDEFDFLESDVAYEIVVTNTNKICDSVEEFPLFPSKLFVPRDDFMLEKNGVASMKAAVYDISYLTAYNIYGNPLPQYVKDRLDKELDAIIGHGYFSVYYISHLLVKNSNDAGYVVGSRGSVGSSFAATMMGITEVNPLKAHYVCPHCKYTAFKFNDKEKDQYPQNLPEYVERALSKADVGPDLEDLVCPICGKMMDKNGFDIAFETFLGFTGEKVPDIDLNFSGEYQAKAHLFCQETFGIDNAFRAGTVSTVQTKTAYAYARDYYASKNIVKRQSELERLAIMLSESKRTTGQHPGGIVVVPDDIEYTDIIPVQYPPVSDSDLEDINWRTSHYDYHKFEDNLLKLDILGHDDPTMVKFLMDNVHKYPSEFPFSTVEGIPYYDKDVISLFSSKKALNLSESDEDKLSSGTIGVPEFGTGFVRGMLETIKPDSISQIIKVSGLSHGTDVWMKNAEDLFKGTNPDYPKITFNEVIGCRDDIMIYLIDKGVPAANAFKIMEGVRKGKSLTIDQEELLLQHNIAKWFIDSCKKIKYLFPKAHATAYVIMALRIGWFKVHRPIYYYAAYFSKRAKEFDAEAFAAGKNGIRNRIIEIETKINKKEDVTNKELALLDTLKIALEMALRGYKFRQIDVNISEATDLVIHEDKKSIYLPFVAVESLGETVAYSIVEARKNRPFTSKKDFEMRTSVNKKQYANLIKLEAFGNLVDDDTTLL